jgi:hypothetical protein
MSELDMDKAIQEQQAFIAGFVEKLEQAKQAQVQTELAMAGIVDVEQDLYIAQLEAQLEAKEAEEDTLKAELRLKLAEMKVKSFYLAGSLAIALVLLVLLAILFSQNYQSCWYLWGEEMGVSFWAKHLFIGCAP